MILARRHFLSLLPAPLIVSAANIMPVRLIRDDWDFRTIDEIQIEDDSGAFMHWGACPGNEILSLDGRFRPGGMRLHTGKHIVHALALGRTPNDQRIAVTFDPRELCPVSVSHSVVRRRRHLSA